MRGEKFMKKTNLKQYLWKGLDLKKYEVKKIIPQNSEHAVILMKAYDPLCPHWCMEYCGNGYYFHTFMDMKRAYENRFRKTLEEE